MSSEPPRVTAQAPIAPVPIPSPQATPTSTIWVGLLAPYVFQAFALLLLTLIVLFRDGQDSSLAIEALIVIGAGNALMGGATTVTHMISRSNVQRDIIAAMQTQPGAPD